MSGTPPSYSACRCIYTCTMYNVDGSRGSLSSGSSSVGSGSWIMSSGMAVWKEYNRSLVVGRRITCAMYMYKSNGVHVHVHHHTQGSLEFFFEILF